MVRLAFHVVVLFAACAATQVPPTLPGTYGSGEPLPPPVAPEPGAAGQAPPAAVLGGTPDPGAEADFRDAKARFDAGESDKARAMLEAFAVQHPQHAFRPAVDLMLARLALLRGDGAGAKKLLEPLVAAPPEPGTGSSARYYLGLAEVRQQNHARARELLLPFLPPAGSLGPGAEALVELRGALAEATAGVGELPVALELLDGYLRGARPHEKAWARARAAEIVVDVGPDAALRAFRAAPERGLSRAVLGAKASAFLRAQGDAGGAADIDSDTASARKAMGGEDAVGGAAGGAGDPGRLGLAIALSGKFQPVGEAAMRAAVLATGALARGQAGPGLYLRDTGAEPDRAAGAVSALVRDEDVIGIVAAADKRGAAPLLAAATESGVPALALDDIAPGAASTAFGLIHAPEARVAALVRAALGLGAKEFGSIGPDSASGKRLRDAFRREVTAGGGRVTAEATYPAGATSFGAAVAAFRKSPPQAVFVADGADRLELIAPALAAADLWSAPWGAPRPAAPPGKPRPRNVLLLSTASELSPKLVQSAGRYVQGALLAPGFYADAADARVRAFLDGYRAAYAAEPHATEAYAFDGVSVLRAVTAAGARTRADALKAIATGSFDGLTGAMRFSPDHARADAPRVYAVEGDTIKAWRASK
jgi:ABC-type branched-subunit amino acid transport system substrate-binding protein